MIEMIKILKIFEKIEEYCLISLFSCLLLIAFLQIVLRNLFATGISYADPLLRHLVLWIGLLGATLATKQDKHIHIDILPRLLPERKKAFLQIAINLFSTIICIFLTYAAIKFIKYEYQAATTLFLQIPIWILEVILPITFAIMAIRFFAKTIRNVFATVKGTSS